MPAEDAEQMRRVHAGECGELSDRGRVRARSFDRVLDTVEPARSSPLAARREPREIGHEEEERTLDSEPRDAVRFTELGTKPRRPRDRATIAHDLRHCGQRSLTGADPRDRNRSASDVLKCAIPSSSGHAPFSR